MGGELRRGAFRPDLRAEIDGQLVGWLAGLGEILSDNDRADADIDLREGLVGDGHRLILAAQQTKKAAASTGNGLFAAPFGAIIECLGGGFAGESL